MDNTPATPQVDLLFEVSWEVCNKIGGIYTVRSTKALAYGLTKIRRLGSPNVTSPVSQTGLVEQNFLMVLA